MDELPRIFLGAAEGCAEDGIGKRLRSEKG